MQAWFMPGGGEARVLTQRLTAQLADSLSDLTEACAEAVGFEGSAVLERVRAIRGAASVPPGVWVRYGGALDAVRDDDPEALAAALREIAEAGLGGPAPVVRNFRDASLSDAMWDKYQRALARDADASVALRPASEREFRSACVHLAAARAQLAAADPALDDEISTLVREVVFARGEVQPGTEFGGATSFFAWGVTFLNAGRHGSPVTMAVGLVHEAAHALLFAYGGGKPMVLNDPGERYSSPLRLDPRGMDGIFHATFVSARMCYALDRLLASDVLDAAGQAEAREQREEAVLAFQRGFEVVAEHARPIPEGAAAMRAAAAYMQGRAGSAAG